MAFLPVIISLGFGLLSILTFYTRGTFIEDWLSDIVPLLKYSDADSGRSLLNVITAGSISITVFSFSMVMVVLSQAANTYSPKILDGLIKDKRPQLILGLYIGTVVFCLPQMLVIGEDGETTNIPALAMTIAILLALLNMFIFIQFIDYVSKSVKPAEICKRIYKRVVNHLGKDKTVKKMDNGAQQSYEPVHVSLKWKSEKATKSGYFQGVDYQRLFDFCEKKDCVIKLVPRIGDYVLKDSDLVKFSGPDDLGKEECKTIHDCFFFYTIEDIERNIFYGYRQLAEVVVKAMSPGINDIGTARIGVDFLTDLVGLFDEVKTHYAILNKSGKPRVVLNPIELEVMFEMCFDEIRIYSRQDKNLMYALLRSCHLLLESHPKSQKMHHCVRVFSDKIVADLKAKKPLADTAYLMNYYDEKVKPLLGTDKRRFVLF